MHVLASIIVIFVIFGHLVIVNGFVLLGRSTSCSLPSALRPQQKHSWLFMSLEKAEKWAKVSIQYCTKCKWGLRASWMAQEVLSTFPQSEVQEVSLVPISDPPGVFVVKVNEHVIWDRKNDSTPGFPEAKELKQLVRDIVVPDKGLGHSDSKERKDAASRVLEMQEGPDRALIAETLRAYLDGLYEGDADKIATAFHESCCLTHLNATSNAIRVVSRNEWLDLVRARQSPQSQRLPRHDEVLLVDIISPSTAFVKLRCAIPPRYFTDSLNLLKMGDRWQIVAKLFAVEVREK